MTLVLELESLKLKMVGNLQTLKENAVFRDAITMYKSTKQEGNKMGNLGMA